MPHPPPEHPMVRVSRAIWPLAAAALALFTALFTALPASAASPADRGHPTPAPSAGGCALPGRTGWTDEGHDTDWTQFRRPAGRLNAVMLFVDFPDAPATETTAEDAAFLTPAADWLKQA